MLGASCGGGNTSLIRCWAVEAKSLCGKKYGGLVRRGDEQDFRQVDVEPFARTLRVCESLAAARGLEKEVVSGLAEYMNRWVRLVWCSADRV